MHNRAKGTLTTLRRGREESDLDLLLAELVRQLDHRVPRPFVHGLAEDVDVVDEVDLSARIDCDLVARPNRQARVVARTEVHDALARRRISLLIDRARDGQFVLGRSSRQVRLTGGELGRVDIDSWRLRTRRHIGASGGRDTVLDVRAGYGIGVERLDIENDGNDVEIEPEAGAQVRGLGKPRLCIRHLQLAGDADLTAHLLEQAQSNTRTEELAKVLLREMADGLNDMLFNGLGLSIRLSRVIRDHAGGEIGVVDRVVDGDGNLKASVVVHRRTGDTSPHRLWYPSVRKRGHLRRCWRRTVR